MNKKIEEKIRQVEYLRCNILSAIEQLKIVLKGEGIELDYSFEDEWARVSHSLSSFFEDIIKFLKKKVSDEDDQPHWG